MFAQFLPCRSWWKNIFLGKKIHAKKERIRFEFVNKAKQQAARSCAYYSWKGLGACLHVHTYMERVCEYVFICKAIAFTFFPLYLFLMWMWYQLSANVHTLHGRLKPKEINTGGKKVHEIYAMAGQHKPSSLVALRMNMYDASLSKSWSAVFFLDFCIFLFFVP